MDDLSALDPGGHIDRLAGLVHRRSLFLRLVRPMIVVMLQVLGQDPSEVLFALDQLVVEALVQQRFHISSAKEFALGERAGLLMIGTPLPVNTSSNAAANLLSRPRIQNLTGRRVHRGP